MSPASAGRRKGGQPGNTNRLRHGLYSKRLLSPAASSPTYQSQITLYRRRLARLLMKQEGASISEYLSYERGIIHFVSLILELKRAAWTGSALRGNDFNAGDGHPSHDLLDPIRLPDHAATRSAQTSPEPIRTSPLSARIPAGLLVQNALRTSNCSSSCGLSPVPPRSENEPRK